jgi:AP2-like factor (ANT lineage)
MSDSKHFKGVTLHKNTNRWEAHVWCGTAPSLSRGKGSQKYVGSFASKEDAARARDIVALKIYGKEVFLNFNKDDYNDSISFFASFTTDETISFIRNNLSVLSVFPSAGFFNEEPVFYNRHLDAEYPVYIGLEIPV